MDPLERPPTNATEEKTQQKQGMFKSVMMFLMHQSYIAALIIMMVRN